VGVATRDCPSTLTRAPCNCVPYHRPLGKLAEQNDLPDVPPAEAREGQARFCSLQAVVDDRLDQPVEMRALQMDVDAEIVYPVDQTNAARATLLKLVTQPIGNPGDLIAMFPGRQIDPMPTTCLRRDQPDHHL